ncbi:2-keto-4-pentenoate hydratase, partial [Archaeoglobales archaeon]
MNEKEILMFAEEIVKAEDKKEQIEPITNRCKISIDEAYQVQKEVIRVKERRGEKIIGKKIGLTNKVIQQAFGVNEPDYGYITNKMLVSEVKTDELIQPRIEAEIAFFLTEDLNDANRAKILKSVFAIPALEIVDSRIKDWKVKIQDTIADNASIARVVLGNKLIPIKELNLQLIGMVFKRNGKIISTGVGANVMGNPILALEWLIRKLAELNDYLKAGEIVLAGSLIIPMTVNVNDTFEAEFYALGCV